MKFVSVHVDVGLELHVNI